jgi:parallel beta-helix repeat protein
MILSTGHLGYLFSAFGSRQCVDYDKSLVMVTISCDMDFSSLNGYLKNGNLLNEESPGVWLLNASIKISPETLLKINDDDTINWLKIIGTRNSSNDIIVSGSADIQNIKITSWNPSTKSVIPQDSEGKIQRPSILVDSKTGQLNIDNSEFGFLGFNQFPSNGLVYSRGGMGSNIENSLFHDMWDGFFSNGVASMTIINNTFYNNLRYGIDIHSSSHDFNVSNNKVFNNSKAGISSSQDSYNIVFDGNNIYQNGNTGAMFSLNTSNSTMSNNMIANESVGISIFSSPGNHITNNTILSSNKTILVSGNSTNVNLNNNTYR